MREAVYDRVLTGDTYFTQFRGLHQIPETLHQVCQVELVGMVYRRRHQPALPHPDAHQRAPAGVRQTVPAASGAPVHHICDGTFEGGTVRALRQPRQSLLRLAGELALFVDGRGQVVDERGARLVLLRSRRQHLRIGLLGLRVLGEIERAVRQPLLGIGRVRSPSLLLYHLVALAHQAEGVLVETQPHVQPVLQALQWRLRLLAAVFQRLDRRVLILVSLFLVLVVLMQKAKTDGGLSSVEFVDGMPLTLAPGEKKWLLLYGVLSGTYRLVLSFAVAVYIAGHYFFIGVLLAVWALILQILLPLWKGLAGAFSAAKNQGKRRRFWLMHALLAMAVYGVLFVLPVRHATSAHGLIALDGKHQIKAGAEGFLQHVLVNNGEAVDAGQPLLVLENASLPAELNAVLAQMAEQEVLLNYYLTNDPTQAGLYRDELQRLRQQERDLRDDLANLTVRSAVAGRVEIFAQQNLPGRYLRKGDLLGHVVAPHGYRVTALVPEGLGNQLLDEVREVRIKPHSDPRRVYLGIDIRPLPQATTQLPDPVLGSLRGGKIPVDTSDTSGTRALKAFFQVEVGLQPQLQQVPTAGRADILLIHNSEPPGKRSGLHQAAEQVEAEQDGGQVHEVEHRQADDDPHRARAANEDEQPVDDERHQQDVDDRRPAAAEIGVEELADRVDHGGGYCTACCGKGDR